MTDSKPFWTREGEIITGVDQVSVEETMHGIRQYQIGSDGGLVLARFAESARYEPKTRSWTLVGVRESRFFEERVETSYQERKDWQFNHDPESIRLRVFVDPNKLSTWDLWRQVRYMRQEGLAAAQYEVALWAALLQPLAILGLILIATGIVVGPLREVGMGQRLAVGVVIGLLFHNIQQFFAPMTTVYGLPAWVAVVLPITAAWFVGILLVRRAR